jgi:hypothetical protein
MLRRKALGAVVMLAVLSTAGLGQSTKATSGADPMRDLPAGDVVLWVNVDSVVNRTAPAWLSGSPAKLKEFNDWLAHVAVTLNLEPRSVKSIVLSATIPETGVSEFASVWTGAFDGSALRKAVAATAGARTETYGGAAVHVMPVAQISFLPMKVGAEPAVAVLDTGTLVAGSLGGVKAAIDTRAGRQKGIATDAELMGIFGATDAAADLRLAMRMPTAQLKKDLERTPNDPTLKSLVKVTYVFGSVNTAQGAAVRLTARSETPADARLLQDSVAGLLTMGRMMAGQSPKMARYAGLLESAAVTTNGADVTLALTVPTTVVQDAFKPAPAPAPETARTPR